MEKLNNNENFFCFFFFILTGIFEKWRILAKNKRHFLKEHGHSSISSRKIITMEMRQTLGLFEMKRVSYKSFCNDS